MPSSLLDYIQALPKTETHLHLEGALPYDLLHGWDPQRFPVEPKFHAVDFRFSDFTAFDETLLSHALPWFTSAQQYYEAARVIFARHVEQNVRYVETSFHLPVTQFIATPGRKIIEAIRAAVPSGLEVRIFAGMLRTDYSGPMKGVIDDLENWDELDGVDLHGHEIVATEPWTARIWERLRAAGKVTKAHAGEFDGPGRVREAIVDLGVRRVQHGVRAIEDPAVVALAKDCGVTFDLCPISNVKLQVTPSLATYPLRELSAAGVRCTISTDDPLVFNNDIVKEYVGLANETGFTFHELARLARNGWEVALVEETIRTDVFREIDRLIEKFDSAPEGNGSSQNG